MVSARGSLFAAKQSDADRSEAALGILPAVGSHRGGFQEPQRRFADPKIFHRKEKRIEAHIFVAYLSHCLHVTLQAKLRQVAVGLTPQTLLEKFETMQMIDVFAKAGSKRVYNSYKSYLHCL